LAFPGSAAGHSGKPVNEENAQKAADTALSKASPLSHNVYKVKLAKVAVTRAILKAALEVP